MMIHKITPSSIIQFSLKHLDTELNKPTNQNSVKDPKVVKPMNKETLF